MKRYLALAAVAVLAVTAGCSTISVETDYDREVDFTEYGTYRWVPPENTQITDPMMDDPIIRSHIRNSVEERLAARGYRRIEEGRPDFLVAYYLVTRNRVDVTRYMGYPFWPHTNVRRYREGTLILDIVDRDMSQLVWRGWATGAFHGREYAHEDIERSVEKILERFPPVTGENTY